VSFNIRLQSRHRSIPLKNWVIVAAVAVEKAAQTDLRGRAGQAVELLLDRAPIGDEFRR
jgi:hypothetical protein